MKKILSIIIFLMGLSTLAQDKARDQYYMGAARVMIVTPRSTCIIFNNAEANQSRAFWVATESDFVVNKDYDFLLKRIEKFKGNVIDAVVIHHHKTAEQNNRDMRAKKDSIYPKKIKWLNR